MSRSDHGLVRIVFELDPSEWHGSATERLWAEPVGVGRYRLRNTPFFAFDVSFEDIVFGQEREEPSLPETDTRVSQIYFAGVSIRGGHSTYRLWLLAKLNDSVFLKYWEPVQRLGCSYEQGLVLAVDVPPSADIKDVYELLEAGLAAGAWEFEEGHCCHPT